jgi:hypothetical protein
MDLPKEHSKVLAAHAKPVVGMNRAQPSPLKTIKKKTQIFRTTGSWGWIIKRSKAGVL